MTGVYREKSTVLLAEQVDMADDGHKARAALTSVKPLPQVGHRPKGVDWSTGVGPAKMSMDDASADLAMMDVSSTPS